MRQLKNRLYTVSTLVPKGARVADIGTDHGHLPIYLIQEGISPFCLACDIKEKPLENARSNISRVGLSQIEARLGAGLDPVSPDEVDCITIAGMGGEVIASILDAADWVKNGRYTLVLQPMTSADALRKYLCENGFSTIKEIACEENRKVYTVIQAIFDGNCFAPDGVFLRIGKLKPDTAESITYIKKQLGIVSDCIADRKKAGLGTDGYDEVCENLLKVLERRKTDI